MASCSYSSPVLRQSLALPSSQVWTAQSNAILFTRNREFRSSFLAKGFLPSERRVSGAVVVDSVAGASTARGVVVAAAGRVVAAASAASSALPDALLFDCDGVLVDTERDGHRISFNIAFAEVRRLFQDEAFLVRLVSLRRVGGDGGYVLASLAESLSSNS